MLLESTTHRLELKHTWTIARGSADYKEYNFVTLSAEGIIGRGEAAHNVRYGESLESIREFLLEARHLFENSIPCEFYDLGKQIMALAEGQNAAKAALDMALLDWVTQKLQIPVHALRGLNPLLTPTTSYSIGIDSPQAVYEKIREAESYPILKIKLGGRQDEEIMRAVREATDRTVRVDANEGWRDRQLALEKIQWLAGLNVQFVEQPMPADHLEEVAWLRDRSPLPLIADEDVKTAGDIPALARAYHGINIKIMKSGGLQEALRMIHVARALGLKIMLGCMIESSLGITAAAHLSPLVDWADLDGNLLIKNDPYRGVRVEHGRIILPHTPGLGVEKNQDAKIG
ncbi:MAG: dipeptide epimerase [candidate division KSB1 bacterium]|nr:dipeptide epimerase [candidate division KSB1 bacterium]